VKPFPKMRDLKRLLSPTLSLDKINAILKYLERSNGLIVDLDGNIIWIKEKNLKQESELSETADFSKEFTERFGKF
jgi:chemotaxis signal transduction protein